MTVMPASGIAMGYFGGKGLPFFGTTFAGIVNTDETKARNGNIAKNVSDAYDIYDTCVKKKSPERSHQPFIFSSLEIDLFD